MKSSLAKPGVKVILGRHKKIGGDADWSRHMDKYVGKIAILVKYVGMDESGALWRVDIDREYWRWRVRNMKLVSSAEEDKPKLTESQAVAILWAMWMGDHNQKRMGNMNYFDFVFDYLPENLKILKREGIIK
ncbi:MAG: hypothetical protein PHP92_03815 [Candidatus Nanoarchaeia archaeon]|nr:hypothetical protein [Candidatus Nanoarchaeia archaeon]